MKLGPAGWGLVAWLIFGLFFSAILFTASWALQQPYSSVFRAIALGVLIASLAAGLIKAASIALASPNKGN